MFDNSIATIGGGGIWHVFLASVSYKALVLCLESTTTFWKTLGSVNFHFLASFLLGMNNINSYAVYILYIRKIMLLYIVHYGFGWTYLYIFLAVNTFLAGWCGEIRDVIFADNGGVTVVYRVTIRGSDGEVWLFVICSVIFTSIYVFCLWPLSSKTRNVSIYDITYIANHF